MPGKPTLQELLEVQRHFGLPSPALVEKDWYVVRALAAIVAIDSAPFQLVFGGGTALSRAHHLTQRMSEDIDLKIVATEARSRGELRELREKVTTALLAAGFAFDPSNPNQRQSGNSSRYTLYQLPYPAEMRGEGALRPEIKIETALWPLRLEAVSRSVASYRAQAFGEAPEIPVLACVALTETLAEKFVALTRRFGEEIANGGMPRDRTLVRHIYDLHVTRPHYEPTELAELSIQVMRDEALAYGARFPAYRKDPIGETLKAVAAMPNDEIFNRNYSDFMRDMVFGEQVEFKGALETIAELAELLRQHIRKRPH